MMLNVYQTENDAGFVYKKLTLLCREIKINNLNIAEQHKQLFKTEGKIGV